MKTDAGDPIIWQWEGKEGDAQPLNIVQIGTGQSGTVALNTTASEVLTNAKALKLTQKTSSGDGRVKGTLILPRALGVPRVRLEITYRLMSDDADFDYFAFGFYDYDGTNYRYGYMAHDSSSGSVEEIQYTNSSGSLVDTGFSYPTDQGNGADQWFTAAMDLDLTNKQYDRLQFCQETDLTAKSMREASSSSYPASYIEIAWDGATTLITALVDSIRIVRLN